MRIMEGMILAATLGTPVEVITSLVIQVDWMGAAAGRESVRKVIALVWANSLWQRYVRRFLETLVACGCRVFALSENRHE